MRTKKAFPRSPGWLGLRSFTRKFAKGRDGSVSVEMGVAAIMFTTLITGLISFGSLFFVQGSMGDAARDAVRRMATGELDTTQAQTYAQAELVNWGMTYTVVATNDGTEATINITVPMGEAALIDFLGIFSGTLSASVTMPVES